MLSRRALIVFVGLCVYLSTAGSSAAPPAEPATVDLKVVTYEGLGEAVRAQKGKILVVDIWATWCPPCIKMMPHLIEMQRKYEKDGVAVMTLTLDEPDQKELAIKLLGRAKASGPNVLLNEKADVWRKKLGMNGPPAVFIFDRDGKRVAKLNSDDPDKPYDHEDVEKIVKDLLQAKP